ncbi:MAG TPA: FAD-dependent thymidylate synthase [Candidatus Woesebacteria bacterium]|nr:FAD-dependent thymidylate synthase [Candidatus Woesebacteria bacterium]HNS94872.1 FAD-dependent thymidylate synthase [Candidatus Woesebacteria bacterium]
MRVQHVAIMPSQASQDAGCTALTPELLAATGARYSRSNDGLDAIVSKINWADTDKSVDSIFKMVDYGHASIADMAPVAMFIDEISLYGAYFLWAQCPTASGQESSTRYIQMKQSGVMTPASLGITETGAYKQFVRDAFQAYEKALTLWTHYGMKHPEAMNIPHAVLNDQTPSGIKKRERMIRNYAFDRARVFLPVCAKTNVMLIMSARNWVELISTLLSHPLKEFVSIGTHMKRQLELVTPRLIRHARFKPDVAHVIELNFKRLTLTSAGAKVKADGAFLSLQEKKKLWLDKYLVMRENRYSPCPDEVRSIGVNFGWRQVAFAEMRDLNRHRTGQKVATLKPNGFYDASDQTKDVVMQKQLQSLSALGLTQKKRMEKMLHNSDMRYFYYSLLGHTYHFEHTTTLDKFIYEAELRTGIGAHYRYAYHLRNCLKLLYAKHPELKGVLFEGTAEPE